MDIHTACEMSYKNGYEKGLKDAVKHGEWIHDYNNLYGCSACLERETMSPKSKKSYCPNCGAKMKG